jgi:hypothetical protein
MGRGIVEQGFSPADVLKPKAESRKPRVVSREPTMVFIQELIHQAYFLLSAVIAVLLLTRLFRRKTRPGLAYDIVYAYAVIPFILRALHIK